MNIIDKLRDKKILMQEAYEYLVNVLENCIINKEIKDDFPIITSITSEDGFTSYHILECDMLKYFELNKLFPDCIYQGTPLIILPDTMRIEYGKIGVIVARQEDITECIRSDYTWTRNGREIESEGEILTIPNFSYLDEGYYKVLVNNKYGQSEKEIKLIGI